MICKFTIEEEPFEVEVEGAFSQGDDRVLFLEKDNLLERCTWQTDGFTNLEIANDAEFLVLKNNVLDILLKIFRENEISVDANFSLENYHRYIKTDAQHQSVIEKTRFLTFRDFNIDMNRLVEQISALVGKDLQQTNPKLLEDIIILRINRPLSMDINPFHRDGYLAIWENVLNVWIPLAGCNKKSSLPVIPGSHLWNEKDIVRTEAKGARINGLSYHVPAILSYKEGLHAILPNPAYGEALIFTPYIVHGAALNRQSDTTRISLELRLYSTSSR